MTTPNDTASAASAPARSTKNQQRFSQGQDERTQHGGGYGAGTSDKRNPSPSTVPSSKQAQTAKPVRSKQPSRETDRT